MTLFAILVLIIGIFLLVKGADVLITSASTLGFRLGVPQAVVGITIIAFGTSLPELVVSVASAIANTGDLAFGNIMGSNITNTFLVLGIAAIVSPFVISEKIQMREILFALVASLTVLFMGIDTFWDKADISLISRSEGLVMFLFLGIFIGYMYQVVRNEKSDIPETVSGIMTRTKLTLLSIGGLIILVTGGYLIVESSIFVATTLGFSQTLIGLTVVAIGTSLPELAAVLTAVKKGLYDIALGNIIGANILNIVFKLAIGAIIRPIIVPKYGALDIILVTASMLLLWFFVLISKGDKITRNAGIALVGIYFVYMIVRVIFLS